MIRRSEHLHDDCLVQYYFSGRRGEAPDPPAAEHLGDCSACGLRYAELVAFLDDVRTTADAESDAVFTTERLRQQQEQILRRVEHASRSARVISFPGLALGQPGIAVAGRVAPRWLAAAAAAGLFVGVAVGGTVFRPGARLAAPPMHVATGQATPRVAASSTVLVDVPASTDSIDDDAFLMQLELALQRPHTRELQAFDALTPHVRPIIGVNR